MIDFGCFGSKVRFILGVTLKWQIPILILDSGFVLIPRSYRMPRVMLSVG